jgi:hypothetical protein
MNIVNLMPQKIITVCSKQDELWKYIQTTARILQKYAEPAAIKDYKLKVD